MKVKEKISDDLVKAKKTIRFLMSAGYSEKSAYDFVIADLKLKQFMIEEVLTELS